MAVTYDPLDGLTPRQLEIVRYAHRGYTETVLCALLDIAPNTLRWHITHIRKCFPTFQVGVPLEQPRLSKREREVAHLVAQGQSNSQIASLLEIKITSVRTYLKCIYRKTGVATRVELVLSIARRHVLLYAQEAA